MTDPGSHGLTSSEGKAMPFEYFKKFRIKVEKQTSKYIKILISDQGGEYTSRAFRKYCR